MKLEDQVAQLEAWGLPLNDGVTIEDLLWSFDRESYEKAPFDRILFMLGCNVEREPFNQRICDRAWHFDTWCIDGTGTYIPIVERLCALADMPGLLTDIEDEVDYETSKGWLAYNVDDERHHVPLVVDEDWADAPAISQVMDHISRDGKRFFEKDNGKAVVLFYLTDATAVAINKLATKPIRAILPEIRST